MNPLDRQAKESPLYQGEDEEIVYSLTTTPWESDPTAASTVVKDSTGTDVTDLVTSGVTSISGDVIKTPTIKNLTADEEYRLEIKFTAAGNIFEAWAIIKGQV